MKILKLPRITIPSLQLYYLRNENLAKTSIIKSLTENHCVLANINSVLIPPNLQENQKNNQDLRSDNPQRKKTLILGDSIVKHVEGWRLNKRMKSAVFVRCIPETTTNAMKHHLKGCL